MQMKFGSWWLINIIGSLRFIILHWSGYSILLGNKTNKTSMNATFSRMKSAGIVEEYKTKQRLTEAFLDDWKAAQ